MESRHESGSSFDLRSGPSLCPNTEKKPGVSFSPFTSELTSQKNHFHHATTPSYDHTNRQMEPHSHNPFGEPHPSPLSPSQNPFESDKFYTRELFDEMPQSSQQGNPFQLSTTSTSTSTSTSTYTNPPPKYSDDDDIPISSMPKHGQQQSSDVAGKYSSSEIQNPPVQVMERSENPVNRIPSNVFSRKQSNPEWSNASNESLFSIHMGNTSFSNDMGWWSKSGELSQIPPPYSPQPPEIYKFNNISPNSVDLQHQGSRVTEEKAAETMREVILENSVTTKHACEGDFTIPNADYGASRSNGLSNSNDHSRHSDGSTKSYAFKVFTDADKILSPKHVEEKQMQQKKPETTQSLKESSNAPQNPKSTPNASQDRWLCCFACCH